MVTRYYNRRLLVELLIVCLGLGIHLWYLFHTTFVDWPEMLLYPWLHSKGLVYYRDITIPFGPGMMYLLYPLYKLFGFTVGSERAIAYGAILITEVLIYCAVRYIGFGTLSAAAGLFFYILWQPVLYGNSLWHETILAPLFVGVFILIARYFKKSTLARVLPIGLALAVASVIKQTVIWPVAIICLCVWISAKNKRVGFNHAVIVGVFPIITNLVVLGLYYLAGLGTMYGFWVYMFPLTLAKATSLYQIIPSRSDIIYVLPVFIPALFLPIVYPKKISWVLVATIPALIALAFPRWGIFRLSPALACASIAFGIVSTRMLKPRRKRVRTLIVVGLCVAGVLTWHSVRVFLSARDRMQPQFFGRDYVNLKRSVQGKVGTSFYILGNYDYLYMGLDVVPVVLPWTQMLPWNAQLPHMQSRVISSLESHRVAYVLYIPYHPNGRYYMDYQPAELLLYLDTNYEKIATLPVKGGILYQRK